MDTHPWITLRNNVLGISVKDTLMAEQSIPFFTHLLHILLLQRSSLNILWVTTETYQ
jgi:hypothetical protein